METFTSRAMEVVAAALLSFLLALWVTWLGLRGLFHLLPVNTRIVRPIRSAANRQGIWRRDAA